MAITYFHLGNARLSSAFCSFTSEFGMGSGGSRLLSSSMQAIILFLIHKSTISFDITKKTYIFLPIWYFSNNSGTSSPHSW